jgi:16S rRNA (guanine527-N7)-methyltransferase
VTEDEARAWLDTHCHVSRGTWRQLEIFVGGVIAASHDQNLIAASTVPAIWERHIVDSAQLLLHASGESWIDFGSGAGFPGLVIAALAGVPMTLVESRRKRIDFLTEMTNQMGLAGRVTVIGRRVEMIDPVEPFAVISARAFAPLPRLFELTTKFSTEDTRWVLPKGRSAADELVQARRTWQGDFRIEPSVTDPEAGVIVAGHVRPKSLAAGKTR